MKFKVSLYRKHCANDELTYISYSYCYCYYNEYY